MDRAFFYRFLSVVTRLELSPIKELELLGDPAGYGSTPYQLIAAQLKRGRKLSEVMADWPAEFSPAERLVVAAAEDGPALAEVLRHLDRVSAHRRWSLAAMMPCTAYAAFMLAGFATFGGGVANYASALHELPAQAGMPAVVIGQTGKLMGLVLMPLAFAAQATLGLGILGFAAFLLWPPFRGLCRRLARGLALHVPWLGGSLRCQGVGSFCRVLGALLARGVPAERAVTAAGAVLGELGLGNGVDRAAGAVAAGSPLSQALRAGALLEPADCWRLELSEDSGCLLERLGTLGTELERRAARRQETFRHVLEPAVIVGFGLVTALLYSSVFLAIVGMSSASVQEVLR
jgi:type II secretory pathway component PulF